MSFVQVMMASLCGYLIGWPIVQIVWVFLGRSKQVQAKYVELTAQAIVDKLRGEVKQAAARYQRDMEHG